MARAKALRQEGTAREHLEMSRKVTSPGFTLWPVYFFLGEVAPWGAGAACGLEARPLCQRWEKRSHSEYIKLFLYFSLFF